VRLPVPRYRNDIQNTFAEIKDADAFWSPNQFEFDPGEDGWNELDFRAHVKLSIAKGSDFASRCEI